VHQVCVCAHHEQLHDLTTDKCSVCECSFYDSAEDVWTAYDASGDDEGGDDDAE